MIMNMGVLPDLPLCIWRFGSRDYGISWPMRLLPRWLFGEANWICSLSSLPIWIFRFQILYSDCGILAPPPRALRLKGQGLGDYKFEHSVSLTRLLVWTLNNNCPPACKNFLYMYLRMPFLPYSCKPFAVNHALTENNMNYHVYMCK